MATQPYTGSGAAFSPAPVNVPANIVFQEYTIGKIELPAWFRKIKEGTDKTGELPTPSKKTIYCHQSRPVGGPVRIAFHGCAPGSDALLDHTMNSFFAARWDGKSPNAELVFVFDQMHQLHTRALDKNDRGQMIAVGIVTGLLTTNGEEGPELSELRRRMRHQSEDLLLNHLLHAIKEGKAQEFGIKLDGKRRRLAALKEDWDNFDGMKIHWTKNEKLICKGIAELMRQCLSGEEPAFPTRPALIEILDDIADDDQKIDNPWLSKKMEALGLAWL